MDIHTVPPHSGDVVEFSHNLFAVGKPRSKFKMAEQNGHVY